MEQLLSHGILNSAIKPSWCVRAWFVPACLVSLRALLVHDENPGRPHFIVLSFITLYRSCFFFFFFYKLKVCDNSALSDDGYHFLAIWQSNLFFNELCSVFLDKSTTVQCKYTFLYTVGNRKIHVTCFIAIFTLL